MTYRGRVRGGVVLLDDPQAIPDGTVVDVCVTDSAMEPTRENPTPLAGDLTDLARTGQSSEGGELIRSPEELRSWADAQTPEPATTSSAQRFVKL